MNWAYKIHIYQKIKGKADKRNEDFVYNDQRLTEQIETLKQELVPLKRMVS